MRTTLDIDEDVLLRAKERARREGRAIGAVMSELARRGLTFPESLADGASEGLHGFVPLPHRGGVVTEALIDRLLNENVEE